jgi:hypothetical protein
MKHVDFSCDWCGAKEPAVDEEDWPEGWTTIDDKNVLTVTNELLCGDCLQYLKHGADVVRAERLKLRGVLSESIAPKPKEKT